MGWKLFEKVDKGVERAQRWWGIAIAVAGGVSPLLPLQETLKGGGDLLAGALGINPEIALWMVGIACFVGTATILYFAFSLSVAAVQRALPHRARVRRAANQGTANAQPLLRISKIESRFFNSGSGRLETGRITCTIHNNSLTDLNSCRLAIRVPRRALADRICPIAIRGSAEFRMRRGEEKTINLATIDMTKPGVGEWVIKTESGDLVFARGRDHTIKFDLLCDLQSRTEQLRISYKEDGKDTVGVVD